MCQVAGTQSEAAYGRRATGARPSYQDRQRVWGQCTECREDMALMSLTVHMQTQHGKEAFGRQNWETTPTGGEPHTYRMEFLTAGGPWNYPIKGCPGWVATILIRGTIQPLYL